MLLEDLGTRKEGFLKLQEIAIAEAKTIDNGMGQFRTFMSGHGLGNPFRVQSLLQRLDGLDLDINPVSKTASIDTPFLRLLRSVAIYDTLRDVKHSARIPIPDSYLLVGIADEGVAYQNAGYKDVFTLQEGQIYGMPNEWPRIATSLNCPFQLASRGQTTRSQRGLKALAQFPGVPWCTLAMV